MFLFCVDFLLLLPLLWDERLGSLHVQNGSADRLKQYFLFPKNSLFLLCTFLNFLFLLFVIWLRSGSWAISYISFLWNQYRSSLCASLYKTHLCLILSGILLPCQLETWNISAFPPCWGQTMQKFKCDFSEKKWFHMFSIFKPLLLCLLLPIDQLLTMYIEEMMPSGNILAPVITVRIENFALVWFLWLYAFSYQALQEELYTTLAS